MKWTVATEKYPEPFDAIESTRSLGRSILHEAVATWVVNAERIGPAVLLSDVGVEPNLVSAPVVCSHI